MLFVSISMGKSIRMERVNPLFVCMCVCSSVQLCSGNTDGLYQPILSRIMGHVKNITVKPVLSSFSKEDEKNWFSRQLIA